MWHIFFKKKTFSSGLIYMAFDYLNHHSVRDLWINGSHWQRCDKKIGKFFSMGGFQAEHDSWIIINVHRNGIIPEKLCNIIGLSGKEDFCRTKLCLCNVALAFWLIFAHYFRITFLSQTFTIFVWLKASGRNSVKNTIRKRCFTARNGAAQNRTGVCAIIWQIDL